MIIDTIKKFEQLQNCEVLLAYYIGNKATEERNFNRDIDILYITTGDIINIKLDNVDIWAVNIFQTLNQKFIFTNPQHIMLLNNNLIYAKDEKIINFINNYKQNLFDEFKQAIAYDIIYKYWPLCKDINENNINCRKRYRQYLYELIFSIFIIDNPECKLNDKQKKILCDIRGKNGYLMSYKDIKELIQYNKNIKEPKTPLSYELLEKIGDSMNNKIFANRYKLLLYLTKKDYNFDKNLLYTDSTMDDKDNFGYINYCIKILRANLNINNEQFWIILNKVYNLFYQNDIILSLGKMYISKNYNNLSILVNKVFSINNINQQKALALLILKSAIETENIVGNEEELNKLLSLIENDEIVKYQYEIW